MDLRFVLCVAGCEVRDTRCGVRGAGCEVRGARCYTKPVKLLKLKILTENLKIMWEGKPEPSNQLTIYFIQSNPCELGEAKRRESRVLGIVFSGAFCSLRSRARPCRASVLCYFLFSVKRK